MKRARRAIEMDEQHRAAKERARLLHEMRTPLTVVMGRLQVLRRRSRLADHDIFPTDEDYEVIEEALARLTQAVEAVEEELQRLSETEQRVRRIP